MHDDNKRADTSSKPEIISVDDPTDGMISISKNQLVVGTLSPTDIYLRLPSGKLVLLVKTGSKIQLEGIHATNSEQVDHLFVHKDDYPKLLGFSLQIAGIAVSRSEINDAKKLHLLSTGASGVFREISALGFSCQSYEHSKIVMNSLIALVEAKDDLRSLIIGLNGIHEDLIKHALATSAVSVMIAEQMGWVMPHLLERIALGGFLHDVGLKEIPEELIFKSRHLMNLEEIKTYEEHVIRGAEILRSIHDIPDDIIAIVMQHHENAFGLGYPRRIKDMRMHPLAKVVCLADCFCDLTMSSKINPKPRSAEEALSFIEFTLGQPFNRQVFSALKAIIKGETRVGRVKVVG